MSDLISREKAVQGVRELFSMGDCYCDELSIVGMLNGLPLAESERTAKVTKFEQYSKSYWATDGRCEGCGCYLERMHNYCPECGARLEWE